MQTTASTQLTKRFIEGLQNHNLTYDEVKDWSYCGGNKGRHLKYFKMCCKNFDLPVSMNTCVCGHPIEENCFIQDRKKKYLLTLGTCCIKRFIPKSSRTCEICRNPHRNRKVNRCNDCRIGLCDGCDKKISKQYSKCYNCNNFG